ncbi:MAG: NDP-sugar synthase, partial [Rubrobacter sp.]|nr:NDP-sugar synthase [Rubrobacter sp.]
PEGQEYDWSKEQFPKMLEEGRSLYGYVTEGYWEDIGNIEQYMGAQKAVLDGEVEGVEPAGKRLKEGVFVGRDARVEEDQLEGPVVLGDNIRLSSGARVGPYSVLASNVSVGEGASIVRSTVGGESTIGEEAELDGALIMRACNIGPRARVLEGSALGDGTRVGEGATVTAGASVLPGESIEEGDEVTEDAS